MASSLGDIVTLVILATFARFLEEHMSKLIKTISIFEKSRHWDIRLIMPLYIDSLLSTVLVIVMVALLPGAAALVWTNRSVKELLFSGWTPIMSAMVISRLVGVLLSLS